MKIMNYTIWQDAAEALGQKNKNVKQMINIFWEIKNKQPLEIRIK